jgi:hypothetical protein
MKNLLIPFFLVLVTLACKKDSAKQAQPNYTIEGRWLSVPINGTSVNTMYEFKDGMRYTYYCSTNNCNVA